MFQVQLRQQGWLLLTDHKFRIMPLQTDTVTGVYSEYPIRREKSFYSQDGTRSQGFREPGKGGGIVSRQE